METKIKVNCHSGYTYAQQPLSFFWNDHIHDIESIESTWIEPGERHFRVRTHDKLFELCYYELQDAWSVTDLS